MSLYTIGDLHLHFSSELKAKNLIEGKVWKNHEERFRQNCGRLIRPEDTLVWQSAVINTKSDFASLFTQNKI